MQRKIKIRALIGFAIVLLVGCINTPLPDYYVLTPEKGQLPADFSIARTAIGLGPLTVPETLNRSNIVTPLDNNQMVVAEYHRWSEPLRENISRVLITNMAGTLGVDKIYAYPWLGNKVDYQIRIDVMQMIGAPKRDVYLQVRWQVLTGTKPARLLGTRITEYRQPVNSKGYSAMVGAFSNLVALLSDDISTAMIQLVKTGSLDASAANIGVGQTGDANTFPIVAQLRSQNSLATSQVR